MGPLSQAMANSNKHTAHSLCIKHSESSADVFTLGNEKTGKCYRRTVSADDAADAGSRGKHFVHS